MYYQSQDKARLKRRRTREAIGLAMQGRWEEAVEANLSILDVFPTDVDAYNRLGKALTELGRCTEARGAYASALAIAPRNTIAKKNLKRLAQLVECKPAPKNGHKAAPCHFIEETGKTGVTRLYHLGPREVVARIFAGDHVYLVHRGTNLVVENAEGQYVGQIEPKLGKRIMKLMEGGNRYVAAVASLDDNGGTLIIKEVFQHPSQAGRLSFPSRAADGFRAYVKDSLLKHEAEAEVDEEEALEEGPFTAEWEEIGSLHEETPLRDDEVTDEADFEED